ncbi:MAG TPA: 50S ribosomal protein L10 [Solirubrobacterales bacterium]|nr:50S ribosomal protein L10 [Solirubrobacterales bacterium]
MENPRPEKVAVVDEVRERLDSTSAALLTEYRGLDVSAISELRRALRAAGGEYKIYKNTLVRFAARDLGLELDELLIGPTALAFITEKPDGTPGDAVDVAKALRDFARTNPNLIVKGGVLGTKPLTADEARALAEVEPRDVLLAKLAGALAAPMVQLAGLLEALPRNFAYGLKALIDQQGGVPEEAPAAEAAAEPEAAAEAPEAPAEDTTEAATDAPEAEAAAATDAPAEEAPTEEPAAEDTTTEDEAPAAEAEAPTEES